MTTVTASSIGLRRWPKPARPGFSLVELLVVIGIIALLIGILIPALSSAKAISQRTACLSNLHQIGLGMLMYANDNKDHFPDKDATGYWAFRRRPGLKDPADPGSYPEWLGLAAVLQGIRKNDCNINQSAAAVAATVDMVCGRHARYIPAKSNVWICPSLPDVFTAWGNTYAFNISDDIGNWTSLQRGNPKNQKILCVWDNSNLRPYTPGVVPGNTLGFSLSPAVYPHKSPNGGIKSRNELYFDCHADTVTP